MFSVNFKIISWNEKFKDSYLNTLKWEWKKIYKKKHKENCPYIVVIAKQ